MPILKSRNQHIKVYRPNGTRYAQGRSMNMQEALQQAQQQFLQEFGYAPRQDETVIEIIGVTADWIVDLFEVKIQE